MSILQRFANPNSGVRTLPPLLIMRTFLGNIIGFYVTRLLMSDPSVPAEIREVQLGDFVDIYLHGILESNVSDVAVAKSGPHTGMIRLCTPEQITGNRK